LDAMPPAFASEFERSGMSAAPAERPALSLVIPLLNEQEVFPQLVERVNALIVRLAVPIEVILIDDGSTDGTQTLIQRVCQLHPAYRGVILSRNFGHQAAISAGMKFASGDA